MKLLPLIFTTALLLVVCTYTVPAIGDRSDRDTRKSGGKAAQVGFAAIVVNGRTLTGPNSSAQSRDGRILVPVATLARSLGDTVQIDAAGRIAKLARLAR